MAASLYPDYPPNLSAEQSDYLLTNLKDWSILHGLAVRPSFSFVSETVDPSRSLAVTAPVTLFPSLFPRVCFEEARAIQKAYNELYALIARDEDWLQEIIEEYANTFHLCRNAWSRVFLGRNLAETLYFVGLLDSNELLTLRSLMKFSLGWWTWMILLQIYGISI